MEMNYLKEKQKMSIALIVSCAAVVLSLLGVAGGLFQETAFYLHECLAGYRVDWHADHSP